MRVARAVGVLGLAALLTACAAQTARPEGIVERWLLSLNQGEAGRPERFAPPEISEQVVPGWATLEPGELDETQVGRATPGDGGTTQVAFRIVMLDGDAREGIATLVGDRIVDAVVGGNVGPTDEGWSVTSRAWMWALAVIAAIVLSALAVAVVRAVRVPDREPT